MSKVVIDCGALKRRRALERALSEVCSADMPLVVELLFVSEEEIRALNARERGVDAVTDVLSFPAMELAAGEAIVSGEHGECIESSRFLHRDRLYLGSVVLCRARAEAQAEEYGHSVEREIYYLAVHGVLHCLGYDHETEEQRAVMRRKEEEVMRKIELGREE